MTDCIDENTAALMLTDGMSEEERGAVEQHAESCVSCRRLLSELARQSDPSLDASPLLPSGILLGRYRVDGVLGSGAMGVVYSAHDPQLGRAVALKLLRPGVSSQLLAEAQSLARLSHPNVVQVYDTGEWEGRVFITLELVRGGTLAEWLATSRSPSEILSAFRAAGAGLEAAHRAGIVHRDFKPDNVLMGDGRVRVTDFGLAIPEGSGGARVAGTPAYLAPELRSGGRADARTDQYSFCAALHEALTGALPGEAAREIDLPRRIRRALERGLAADPAARFASMAQLLSRLEWNPAVRRRRIALVAGAVALAVASSLLTARAWRCRGGEERWERVLPSARRARLHAPEARSRALAGEDSQRARRLEQLIDGYRKDWIAMYTDACTATRVRADQSEELLELRMGCLDSRLAQVDVLVGLLERGDATINERLAQREVLEPLAACADRAALLEPVRPPKDAAARARVQSLREQIARATAADRAGEYQTAHSLAAPRLEEARALAYGPVLAEALELIASVEEHQSDLQAADRDYRAAALTAEAARYDHLAARARTNLAWLAAISEDRAATSAPLLGEAEAALARVGPMPEEEARLLEVRSAIASANNQPDEARALAERALALVQRTQGKDSLAAARVECNLGVDEMLSRPDDARAHLEHCLRVEETRLGPHHPMVLVARSNLVGMLLNSARVPEARAQVAELLALQEAELGSEHEDVATTLRMQAEVLMYDRATRSQAPALMERALAILTKRLPGDHFRLIETEGYLAETLLRNGRIEESLRHSEREVAEAQKRPGPQQIFLRQSLGIHAEALLRLGHPAEARAELERVLALPPLPGGARQTAEARFELVKARWALKPDRALSIAQARTAEKEFASDTFPDDERLEEVRAWLRQNAPR